jgi:hypothetical protein
MGKFRFDFTVLRLFQMIAYQVKCISYKNKCNLIGELSVYSLDLPPE